MEYLDSVWLCALEKTSDKQTAIQGRHSDNDTWKVLTYIPENTEVGAEVYLARYQKARPDKQYRLAVRYLTEWEDV